MPGLTFGVYSAGVKINKAADGDTDPANDPAKLDWTTFFDNATGTDPQLDVNDTIDLQVYGSVALDAFGVLIAKGSFRLELGTVIEKGTNGVVDDANTTQDDTVYQKMVLTLGTAAAFDGFVAEKVEVFIGVGGELSDPNNDDNDADGSFVDDQVITSNGLGLYASLESLTLVTLKDGGADPTVTTDDKSYMGLEIA